MTRLAIAAALALSLAGCEKLPEGVPTLREVCDATPGLRADLIAKYGDRWQNLELLCALAP